MGSAHPDPRHRSQLFAELEALLQSDGAVEGQLRQALPLLAALADAGVGALYLPGEGERAAWRRHAWLGEEAHFPARLPAAPAASSETARLLPFAAQGRLQGFCLLAAAAERPLGPRRARALAQAGSLLGLRLAAAAQAEAGRQLELRFAAISESSPDHIWELDARGRYRFNSTGCAQLLGYRPEELNGRRPLDFVHPDDRARLRAAMAHARATKEPLSELVHRAIGADGDEVYVESRAFPILDAAGRLRGYRGVDRNITDWFQAKRVMEETLIGTCEALGRMVELRDPYTKGHSVRVAAIAVALGQHLGRSPYELQGLQLMGLLHDIGKVGIPTEILSKPTRLGPEEMELMRQHPQMGYEILKDISFPWPVAAVVLQHHERLDGSGYPQGLTGAELMWQVRVLAVSDLLEAMATDRPYRPGLGLDVALRELQQQRALLYDPEIVDAAFALAAAGELAAILARRSVPEASEARSPAPAALLQERELEQVPRA